MALPPRELTLTVLPEWEGASVRALLRRELGMADSLIARLKLRPDGIRRNGERCRTVDRLSAGDVLTVRVDDGTGGNRAEPAALPLSIVYEDEDLAVIDKPPGLAVHGVPGGAPTLVNVLAARWGTEQPFHPVHRLDRGTSGLMAVAKSAYIQERLRREMHSDGFRREYLALVCGTPSPPSGVIDAPIGREAGHRTRRTVAPDGQPARTEYETISAFPDVSLVRLRPLTGRTHQLRVHMAHIGCPLAGDVLYGGDAFQLSRPALHSARLVLRHPVKGQELELFSPLPEDIRAVLERAKNGLAVL